MTETIVQKVRLEWVDIAKGIGIILVVFGHSLFNILGSEHVDLVIPTITSIYLFHMPLFLFINGFLFKKDDKVLESSIYQFTRLVIPFLCYFALATLILIATNQLDKITISDFIKYLWNGRRFVEDMGHLHLTPMWYLLCLFNTRILYNFIIVKYNKWVVNAIIVICLLLAYTNSMYYPSFTLPFCLHMVAFAIVIFHLGNLYKRYDTKNANWLIIIIGMLAILCPIFFNIGSINIAITNYGTPIFTLLCSILGVLFVINISKILSKMKYVSTILSEPGKASLVIMALHLVFYPIIAVPLFGNNPFGATFVGVLVSYIMYRLFDLSKVTQIAFMGKGISKEQIHGFLKHLKYNNIK